MATLTSQQLKDSYQSLVTIGDSITSNPTSGVLENGLGNPVTRLGIGTSTEDWSSIFDVLRVGKTASLFSYDSIADGLFLANNVYFDTTLSEYAYISTDPATLYQGINGDHIFYNAPSGTADAQVTFTERMRIKSDGDISFQDGSASEAFYWDASAGSLGIGTNSPNRLLHLYGGADTTWLLMNNNATGSASTDGFSIAQVGADVTFINRETGYISFQTSDVPRMTIDSSGNVLVGKTSSTGVGTGNIEVSNASSATVQIEGGTNEWSLLVSSSADALRFYQDSTEHMRIDSSGNVGIGNTSPSSYGKTTIALGSAGGNVLALQKDSGAGIAFYGASFNATGLLESQNANGDMVFYTGTSGVSEKFRIYAGGNVGITTGNLILDSGAGIDFSDTPNSSGTMTSELLDDYEEGTWTPSFAFDVGGTGVVYGTRSGNYTKVGNLVYINFVLTVSSGLSGSDYFLRLSGIPFNGTDAGQTIGRVFIQNPNNATFNLSVEGGGTSFLCYATNGATDFARGDDVNGVAISGAFTYRAS